MLVAAYCELCKEIAVSDKVESCERFQHRSTREKPEEGDLS